MCKVPSERIQAVLLRGSLWGLLMEEADRELIQQLKATNDRVCCELADAMTKALESPNEMLEIIGQLRPVIGERKALRSIADFLITARTIGRALLAGRGG